MTFQNYFSTKQMRRFWFFFYTFTSKFIKIFKRAALLLTDECISKNRCRSFPYGFFESCLFCNDFNHLNTLSL